MKQTKKVLGIFSTLMLVTICAFAQNGDGGHLNFTETMSKFVYDMGIVQFFIGDGWKSAIMIAKLPWMNILPLFLMPPAMNRAGITVLTTEALYLSSSGSIWMKQEWELIILNLFMTGSLFSTRKPNNSGKEGLLGCVSKIN